jgi:hypothetical protein
MIILLVIAVVVVGAPLAAICVVSLAVFREESLHSLIGRAPGPIEHRARRVLAFHSEAICEPVSQADAWRAQLLGGGRLPGYDLGDGRLPGHELLPADEPIAATGGSPWRTGR